MATELLDSARSGNRMRRKSILCCHVYYSKPPFERMLNAAFRWVRDLEV